LYVFDQKYYISQDQLEVNSRKVQSIFYRGIPANRILWFSQAGALVTPGRTTWVGITLPQRSTVASSVIPTLSESPYVLLGRYDLRLAEGIHPALQMLGGSSLTTIIVPSAQPYPTTQGWQSVSKQDLYTVGRYQSQ